MIIEHKGTETVTGGAAGSASAFAINNTAMAFKILSSKLYNDKVLAPIRELSCNAWDAHVAAGIAHEPFEVNLPNSFDPMFRIKDHGVGLDDEGIHSLYCRYFGSNKSDSNAFVGAMGLGSKSPFCYTDGFTVVAIFNGTKRTYDAHLSEEGMPEVILLSEEPTDEHNGLEVSFPVPPSDFFEFQNKAKVALEFIQPRPVVNLKHFAFTDTEYVVRTDKWGIRKEPRTHQTSGPRAIQGMVAYSIGRIDESKTNAAQKRILEMPVDLFFTIGDLDVAASRETLDNTKRTVANVLTLVDEVYQGLVDELKAKLNSAKTAWEARLFLNKMHDSPLKEVVKAAEKNGDIFGAYDNFILNREKPTINQMDYENLTIAKFNKHKKSLQWATKSFLFNQKASGVYQSAVSSITSGLQKKDILDVPFEVEPTMLFVLNDIKFGGEKYIHYLLQQDTVHYPNFTEVYYMTAATTTTKPQDLMDDAARLIAEIGSPDVVALSTLKALYGPIIDVKKPTYSSHLPRERKSVLSLNFKGKYSAFFSKTTYSFWTNWVKAEEKQFGAVNYYVVLQPDQKPTWGNFTTCEKMIEIFQEVRSCGYFGMDETTPVFGLKPNSKLIGQPDWVELGSHIENTVKSLMTAAKQKEMCLLLGSSNVDREELWVKIADQKALPLSSPARKFADEYLTVYRAKESKENQTLRNVLNYLRGRAQWAVTIQLPNYDKREDDVIALYPMMSFTNYSFTRYEDSHGRNYRKVLDYITLVDNTNAQSQQGQLVTNLEEIANVTIN